MSPDVYRHRCFDWPIASRARILHGDLERRTAGAADGTIGIRTGNLTYDPERRLITWSLTYDGLSGPAMMAHIHGPAAKGRNGPPVIWLNDQRGPNDASRLRLS